MSRFYSISKENRVKYLSFGDCWRSENSHAVLSASNHPKQQTKRLCISNIQSLQFAA
jgi:hypothetical protein